MSGKDLYLGLDLSTQALKAVVVDGRFEVLLEEEVNFDRDLAEFGTTGGAHRHPDGLTVTAPALMWAAALDRLLEQVGPELKAMGRVMAISGSGQQHGSVWLRRGARSVLRGLTPERPLREQVEQCFSLRDSPIWMDSSTGAQCTEREKCLGGRQRVADLTGSRAYERFTGNQIARLFREQPGVYEATERIALVSSFVASLLIGDYAAIDFSDGSGMNLLDIRAKAWSEPALDCTAPDLASRLGAPAPSHSQAGGLHSYYAERFGMERDCPVIAFSGDNPNSLAGLRVEQCGDIAVSLGTSDTVFGILAEPAPSGDEGHVFVNPVDPGSYMGMLCYRNGSLTREFVRDAQAGGSWERFSGLLRGGEPGNGGRIGFFFREPEITPPILGTGVFRFDADDRAVPSFTPAQEVRAAVEGTFLSMRLHAAKIGMRPERLFVTGGGSSNNEMARILSDVFGAPVFRADHAGSAAMGAAYRAIHGLACMKAGRFVPFREVMAGAPPFTKVADPDSGAHRMYTVMLDRYEELERTLQQKETGRR